MFKFSKAHGLLPEKGDFVFAAVSGGPDSMALLDFLIRLRIKLKSNFHLRIIHIDHGQRQESSNDIKIIHKYLNQIGSSFPVLSFQVLDPKELANEKELRNYRYSGISNLISDSIDNYVRYEPDSLKPFHFASKKLENKTHLFLGQHLNDAFEWDLLKQFKTSSDFIGTPLINGIIKRPFFSVTKKQILNYLKIQKIPFLEDQTNELEIFERNFIRARVEEIEARFPKYLKHWVIRKNKLLGLDQIREARVKEIKKLVKIQRTAHLITVEAPFQIFKSLAQQPGDREILISLLKDSITSLSSLNRGNLGKEVVKYLNAKINGKSGPFLFSGGVHGAISKDGFRIYKKNQ